MRLGRRRFVDLARIVSEVPAEAVSGPTDGVVSAVVYNAARATPGALFVAVPGRWHDGHDFIPEALSRGACAVIGARPIPADWPADHTYIRVPDPRRALGLAAAAFYGHPTRRMEVIGVTGTDGKTTTTNLIEALLARAGRRTGLMSTVDFKIGDRRWQNDTRFTTLEAPEVQALLLEMAEDGVQAAVVETTSSGLALHRVAGVEYDVAVVTNITTEHLEVHGTLENYRRAKAMLVEAVDPEHDKPLAFAVPRVCVLNADDSSFAYLKPFCRAPLLAYGIENPAADVWASDLDLGPASSRFRVHLPGGGDFVVTTPLVARFNVSNCLAAIAVARAHGLAPELIADVLAHAPSVPGRMQRIDAGQPFTVVVDYAHTPDSLEKVLTVLRPLTAGHLIAVFGSAGDRDRVKRPLMGAVAARLADFAVITDEDPREEDAAAILREIARGAEEAGARAGEQFIEVVDRRKGIAAAFALARPGDTVLLAGKGHEQSIIIGREKIPWDDGRIARELLAELARAP
jgi:UDP-N-acetylmuramoyl-L-alanyl-D-glutamate--2,6-diaminopimelate ligase